MHAEWFFSLVVGVLFIGLGLMIWRKQKINWIHAYHYKNVKESDRKPYTAQIGKGLMVIGGGMMVTGLWTRFLIEAYNWVPATVGFVVGFAVILRAQKRYNGGLF